MSYDRDPLLEKICDRIHDLAAPAFVKNSEMVCVAANRAFARLFDVEMSDLVGTGGTGGTGGIWQELLELGDMERACLVFGEEQSARFSHPSGKGRFTASMERFTIEDGQTFLYCVFEDQSSLAETQDLPVLGQMPGAAGCPDATLLLDNMDIGVCVWNRAGKLTYFNQKLVDLYKDTVNDIRIGMDIREIVEQAFRNLARQFPNRYESTEEAMREWVEDRVARYNQPSHSRYQKLVNDVWVKSINHTLADGSVVCLRIDFSEMKEHEERLQQRVAEVELYRELLNRLPVAVFARGPDQRIAVANQCYADLFGRSVEDLIHSTELELFGDYAPHIRDANRDTLENGTEYEEEQEVPVAGKRIASTIVKTGRMVSKNGVPYVVGTVVDITPIRQRELQLQEANAAAAAALQDLKNIVGSLNVGLIVLDSDMTILLANEDYFNRIWPDDGACSDSPMVGRGFEDILQQQFLAGRRPTDFQDMEDYCRSRLDEIRSGPIQVREYVFVDGTVMLYSSLPLSGGRFMLCYLDVTALRRRDNEIEQARREADEANRLVRYATDTMPEGLMVIEGEHIVFANASFAPLINVPAELLEPGCRWEDVFRATCVQNPSLEETSVQNNLDRFREALNSGRDVSYNFPIDNERWVHLEMRSRDDGQSIVLCSDETVVMKREAELKRLIAEAEAADRAKSEFLAHMGLEIRTPMNGILGMAELLGKSNLDTRQRAFIEIIIKSGNTLLTIINDILDFARLDAGKMQLKYAAFDPGEALEDAASLFASIASEKDVALVVKRSPDIPAAVMGDAGRFRQIISNLVANAVKFTDQGYVCLSIHAESENNNQVILNVVVEDTGCGIASDKLAKIFDKFSQVDLAVNRREGTGLGLAISQRLASIQGGTISVHSSQGKGSVFTLSLPFQIASENSRSNRLPVNIEGARILVVGDHEIARNNLLHHIGVWGFECVGATDGADAYAIMLAAAASNIDLDVVLIDSHLPDMQASKLASRLRADPRLHRLSVILLTTIDAAIYDPFLADIDVQAYLTKPIRIPLLKETLIDVIRARRVFKPDMSSPVSADRSVSIRSDVHVDEAISSRRMDDMEYGAGGRMVPLGLAVPRADAEPYVLIVEDNEVNQIFFSQILDGLGLSYKLAQNGSDGVDAWYAQRPALILMDTSMPVMDGFEATLRIRTIEAMTGGWTPIIGLVNHAQETDPERCLATGMSDYIFKPVTPEQMEEKILHWIKQESGVITNSRFYS